MSTSPTPPEGRAAIDDVADKDRPESNHLSLPVFHSVRDPSNERDGRASRTGSPASASGSHRTGRRTPEPGHNRLLERLSFGGSSARSERSREKEREKEKENDAPRHNVSRTSGGFLLEPVSDSKRLSRGSATAARKSTEKKRDGGESELTVTKRRHKTDGYSNPSFRSSPLASEVKQDPIIHHSPSPDQLVVGTDIRRSLSSSYKGSGITGSSASTSHNTEAQKMPLAQVGYDNDPAHIVNMALSLNEGRRRLASGRRYVSTEHGDRRVISIASTMNPSNSVRRRSIAPFMSTKRQLSHSRSPGRRTSAKHRDSVGAVPKLPIDTSVTELDDDLDFDPGFADHVSPATAARVEKAKIYFELAHEHRRLLPHLPPLRRPGTPAPPGGPETQQKAYNPLQYVRNRKLRIWEKTPINSEAEGWHDVQKVRAWVDALISSHAETQHDPLECVRLPPLDLRTVETTGEDADPEEEPKSTLSHRAPDQLHPKPSRPRSDWVTHPADMIADAYWLEQGLNKTKIQDRDNNLIYPPDTHFKFSGWRNRTPAVEVPNRLQQPSPPPEPHLDSIREPPPSALPELPTFKSAHHHRRSGHHGRRRDIIRDSLQPKEGSSSRERSRIRKKLFQDSSDSEYSSLSSDGERGRRRLRRKRQDASTTDTMADQGSHLQLKQPPQTFGNGHGDSSQGSSAPTSKRGSIDHSALNKLFRVDSLKKASPLTRSRNRQEASQHRSSAQVPIRSSLEHDRQPRASTDYDTTTAPSSPTNLEWPSIAINLSPPPSRTGSPARKPISTILQPFHRKTHKEQGSISRTDFAHVPPVQVSQDPAKHTKEPDSRGQSPMTRGVSPLSKNRTHSTEPDDIAPQSSNEQRHSVASKVSTRSAGASGSDHSRLRGIFKGGRIAEIVGNEVSRVGDFIWKRDPPTVYRHRGSASEGSIRSYKSDSDKEHHHHHHHQNGTVLKTPPPLARSRSSTLESTPSDQVSPITAKANASHNDRPRYNNPNLPSFTSPFQRDRDHREQKEGLLAPEDAGIRQVSTDNMSHLTVRPRPRSNSRSPRLAQLPKLDTGAPTTPNELSRQNTYGFGAALDLSRSRDASDQLNSVLGPVTGLTRLRTTRSTGDLSTAGGSQAGLETREAGDVTSRDIERAFALLLSSTVKAREIGRRADDSGEDLPRYLYESLTAENKALHSINPLRVRKRERHIVAAQNIMKTLEGYSSTFNTKLHSFTSSQIPALHIQLQSLEDQVENTMTPQVRVTADSAGELSMKLSTTSTLAVKELNDTIEVAFRRKRRGPIRLFRKLWFAGIEWTVVGLLWLIWAVVSVIQAILGVGRCLIRGIRWMFWVE
ncbi:hypothetical protein PV04_00038 [Phialophora macrospora]|uniref:Uncharacterized protein n=1 Tax=Phialophora macrospora TaxID=1851006 RepID=A0A0D2FZ89_9EURO|nr:hypothetical protein PV04_00038 [Phialophora macrospora]